MIDDQPMLKAMNEHGIYRDTTRGNARKGMEFLRVIYNGYANHDRSESYLKDGLKLWWDKYGIQLGYFTFTSLRTSDVITELYASLETMKKSQD